MVKHEMSNVETRPPSMKITILLSFIIIYIYSSISVSAFADEEMNKSNDENMFFYYKTEYGALSDDESDLILDVSTTTNNPEKGLKYEN